MCLSSDFLLTHSQMEWNMEPCMAILGMWIMLMIASHERTSPQEQVAFIRLETSDSGHVRAVERESLLNLTLNARASKPHGEKVREF